MTFPGICYFVKFKGNNFLSVAVTADARRTLNCELDIPYGTTDRTKYDVYGTNLPKGALVNAVFYF